ncbi:MAG: CHRD domain-containing protein [Terriglobia bacterium]
MRKLMACMTMMTLLTLSFPRHYKADDNSNSQDGQGKGVTVRALLTGYQEVPAVSTTGVGQFDAQLSDDKTKLNFTLKWKNLEGTSVTKADLRFGQFNVNGDVIALLCGTGSANVTCGDPASGSITGSIAATDILGPKAQGIDPTESTVFDEVLKAIGSTNTYVTIHTDKFADGEIRGQVLYHRFGLLRH